MVLLVMRGIRGGVIGDSSVIRKSLDSPLLLDVGSAPRMHPLVSQIAVFSTQSVANNDRFSIRLPPRARDRLISLPIGRDPKVAELRSRESTLYVATSARHAGQVEATGAPRDLAA